ncbi:MAG: molecular chaperone HtpG [Pseudomonadota bacterium]
MSKPIPFSADVTKLLSIVAKSLYSDTDVFLRELISNASDSYDRLRHQVLTRKDWGGVNAQGRIEVRLAKNTITVADRGMGMTKDELSKNLGTIARSGSAAYLEALADKQDVSFIGQFGLGFYSAFMVADRVEVIARAPKAKSAWRWQSDGQGNFTIDKIDAPGFDHGAEVILHIRKDKDQYLDKAQLEHIIRRHSSHIELPIDLVSADGTQEINGGGSALWTQSYSDSRKQEYESFYQDVCHGLGEPWLTIPYQAEGIITYSALLFIPSLPPFDLYQQRASLRLYVRRVLVDDKAENILPDYLRFVVGVVDSPDLPLNVSREMLQDSPVLAKISSGLTRKVLGAIKEKAKNREDYAVFWNNFGAVLKEGLIHDPENRETIGALLRFQSTAGDDLTSLAGYKKRAQENKQDEKTVLYLAGSGEQDLARSPHLEGFIKAGQEVALLRDPVDSFWTGMDLAGMSFKSVTREDVTPGEETQEKKKNGADKKEPKTSEAVRVLTEKLKTTLEVKDVRVSTRLAQSPACLVAGRDDPDLQTEALLRQRNPQHMGVSRVLEINPEHPAILALAKVSDESLFESAAHVLFAQTHIAQGLPPVNPAQFTDQLGIVLERALNG